MARDKPLKVDEILAERSAVPAIIARVKAANTEKKESKHDLQKVNQIAKRKREGAIPATPKKKKKQTKQATYDMWGDGRIFKKRNYLFILIRINKKEY